MKFEIGDTTDQALTTTLAHELVLCNDCFERFASLAKANIMGRRDKTIKIKCHDAYASFLHHLYEFYVGCIKRDRRNIGNIPSIVLDRVINNEAKKLLKNRVEAIKGGYAPDWENHISVYQVEVPDEFSTQFRNIRNRTAHASTKRSAPENDLSLKKFYENYHRFVYLLYYSAQCSWTINDIEAYDWKAIEEFDLAVQG